MGTKIEKKLVVLIVLFLVTGVLAYVKSQPNNSGAKAPLQAFLNNIDGYQTVGILNVEQDIYDFLELDDYAYTAYRKNGVFINLYIGYYFSGDKISSAHSPLVCFPGQGWEIDEPKIKQLAVGEYNITFAETIATLGTNRQLIIDRKSVV